MMLPESPYYDRQGNNISHEDALALFADRDGRRVAFTRADKAQVSTVFLILDHSCGIGEPMIFETMVFGGPLDGACQRYATEAEALAGHKDVVHQVRTAHRTMIKETRGIHTWQPKEKR